MELQDLYDFLENEVVEAYYNILETMEHYDVAPPLAEIYEEFYLTALDNIEDAYEAVFGEGSTFRPEWLADLGINIDGIPNLLTVCRVLNLFRLGYTFNGVLYNFAPQRLLREEVVYE